MAFYTYYTVVEFMHYTKTIHFKVFQILNKILKVTRCQNEDARQLVFVLNYILHITNKTLLVHIVIFHFLY